MPNDGMNAPGPSNDEYETPDWLFRTLDHEFAFTMDGAARVMPTEVLVGKERSVVQLNNPNSKCPNACTKEANMPWFGHRVFCNPPYSDISPFVHRAWADLDKPRLVVFLLPTTVDNDWFDTLKSAERRGEAELRYFRKRIKFCLNGVAGEAPRFTSMLAIVRP